MKNGLRGNRWWEVLFGLILSNLPILITPANAVEEIVNLTCDRIHISSLKFEEVDQKWVSPGNYCLLQEEQIPSQVMSILYQIEELSQKAARALKIDLKQLIVHPYEVIVNGNPSGPFLSAVSLQGDTPILYLGVFPDWSGEFLNSGIYVHELGHVVATTANPALIPQSFSKLAQVTHLLTESIADLLAYETVGAIISQDPSLPPSIQNLRKLDTTRTYRESASLFSGKHSLEFWTEWCGQLDLDHGHTAHSKILCNDFLEQISEIEKDGEKKEEGEENPLKRAKIDDSVPLSDLFTAENMEFLETLDPHQIGLPFLSFLLDLKFQTGTEILPMFFLAMKLADLEESTRYVCQIPALGHLLPQMEHRSQSPKSVFPQLRGFFKDENEKIFSQLWDKHAMDLGFKIADEDGAFFARSQVKPLFNKKIYDFEGWDEEHLKNPILRKTACWAPLGFSHLTGNELIDGQGDIWERLPGCAVTCKMSLTEIRD